MNQEKLRFIPGGTLVIKQTDEPDAYEAQIDVIGEEVWMARICVYGYNEDNANGLRDRVLWGLNQPTVPAQWQRYSPGGTETDGQWVNLDNGGEAARLKGEGYEIRALYQKQPLQEV